MNDSTVSKAGSPVKCLRSTVTTSAIPRPTPMPPMEAQRKSPTTVPTVTSVPKALAARPAAARAVRRVTRAVASLTSDSPSRIETRRRGRPIWRPIDVAATASGGATTAPRAKATQKSMPSAHWRKTATPSAVKSTSPTDRLRMTARLLRKSTSDVRIAAAYSSGGRMPSSTISGLRATSGTNGR